MGSVMTQFMGYESLIPQFPSFHHNFRWDCVIEDRRIISTGHFVLLQIIVYIESDDRTPEVHFL